MSYKSYINELENVGFVVEFDFGKALAFLGKNGYHVDFEHYRYPVVYTLASGQANLFKKKAWLQVASQSPGNRLYRYYRRAKNSFAPYPKGGKTICRVYYIDGCTRIDIAYGESRCMMIDNFCYREGKKFALENALKNGELL
jgi:hypothetical protein